MNILVTGCAGGIGSTLCILLKNKGHTVTGIDNMNNGYKENLFEDGVSICDFANVDIRNTQELMLICKTKNIHWIIHLAAITALPVCESNPYQCIDVNVAGTASVLTAARRCGAKVIFASTSAIYENNDKLDAPFRENLTVSPKLLYPLSKKLAEDVVKSFQENYNIDVVTLRFFNVFGPRQDIHRKSPPLINYIVREIKHNRSLNFFSDGNQVRDYVHVNDVLRLIELCLTYDAALGKTFNVCTSTLTSVRDIVSFAEQAFDRKLQYTFNDAKDYWLNYPELNTLRKDVIAKEVNKFALGSYDNAKTVLNWQPNVNITSLMIETMRENFNKYN